jgi:hypothetical protein
MTAAHTAALRRLYGPTSRQLLDQLPDIGDGLQRRLLTAAGAPELELIDALIRDASGLGSLLMRLKETLLQEAGAGGSRSA